MPHTFDAILDVLKFDPTAYDLGLQRMGVVADHTQQWSILDPATPSLNTCDTAQCLHSLQEQHRFLPQSSVWNERIYSLGCELEIKTYIHRIAVERCRNHGWFDFRQKQRWHRPSEETAWQRLDGFFAQETKQDAITWLVDHQCCRSADVAAYAAEMLHPITLRGQGYPIHAAMACQLCDPPHACMSWHEFLSVVCRCTTLSNLLSYTASPSGSTGICCHSTHSDSASSRC